MLGSIASQTRLGGRSGAESFLRVVSRCRGQHGAEARSLDLDGEQLRKVAGRHASVLSTSIDSIESKIDWLQTRLDLDDEQLRKIVLALPPLGDERRGQPGADARSYA